MGFLDNLISKYIILKIYFIQFLTKIYLFILFNSFIFIYNYW